METPMPIAEAAALVALVALVERAIPWPLQARSSAQVRPSARTNWSGKQRRGTGARRAVTLERPAAR